jgi:quercetin dioxygenase-like cupin family protein
MAQIRRVVTGHDRNGRAVVRVDEVASDFTPIRSGASWKNIWSTVGFPVDNTDETDGGKRDLKTSEANGTVFRVVRYEPGVAPRVHRTDTIDYAVVISGELDMQLDGTEVHLKAGDVVVQRGTVHNWVNRGTEPCLVAFVLIDAKPANAGGKVLEAKG